MSHAKQLYAALFPLRARVERVCACVSSRINLCESQETKGSCTSLSLSDPWVMLCNSPDQNMHRCVVLVSHPTRICTDELCCITHPIEICTDELYCITHPIRFCTDEFIVCFDSPGCKVGNINMACLRRRCTYIQIKPFHTLFPFPLFRPARAPISPRSNLMSLLVYLRRESSMMIWNRRRKPTMITGFLTTTVEARGAKDQKMESGEAPAIALPIQLDAFAHPAKPSSARARVQHGEVAAVPVGVMVMVRKEAGERRQCRSRVSKVPL